MYQTVGQEAIGLIAKCLDVPLYRRVISGGAVDQGLDYGDRGRLRGVEGDETEDLYTLLSEVKVAVSRHILLLYSRFQSLCTLMYKASRSVLFCRIINAQGWNTCECVLTSTRSYGSHWIEQQLPSFVPYLPILPLATVSARTLIRDDRTWIRCYSYQGRWYWFGCETFGEKSCSNVQHSASPGKGCYL